MEDRRSRKCVQYLAAQTGTIYDYEWIVPKVRLAGRFLR
jgi:hypothetical protein